MPHSIIYVPYPKESFSQDLYERLEWFNRQQADFLLFASNPNTQEYLILNHSLALYSIHQSILAQDLSFQMAQNLLKSIKEKLDFLKQEHIHLYSLSLSPKTIFFQPETQKFHFCLLPLVHKEKTLVRQEECLELFFLLYQHQLLTLSEADFLSLSHLLEKNIFDFFNAFFQKAVPRESASKLKADPTTLPKEILSSEIQAKIKPTQEKWSFPFSFKKITLSHLPLICLGLSLAVNLYLWFTHQKVQIFLEGLNFFYPLLSLLSLILFFSPHKEKVNLEESFALKENHLLYLELLEANEQHSEHFVLDAFPFHLSNRLKFKASHFLYHFEHLKKELALQIFVKHNKLYVKNLGEQPIKLQIKSKRKKGENHPSSLQLFPEDAMLLPESFYVDNYHFQFYLKEMTAFSQ